MYFPKQTGKSLPAVILIVIAVVLIIFGLFFYFNPIATTPPQTEQVMQPEDIRALEETLDRGDLRGVVYLTLREKEEKKMGLFVYFLDGERGLVRTAGGDDQGFSVLNEHTTTDDQASVYVAFPNLEEEGGGVSQIAMYTGVFWKYLTTDNIPFKHNPEWSPDSMKIAYMALQEGATSFPLASQINAWDIYTTDLEGDENFIAEGVYPQWSPDGNSLVFLDLDGLRLFDLTTQQKELVVSKENNTPSRWNEKIDVSRDGTMIAWSKPDDGEVTLIKIESWAPFRSKIQARIPINAFWSIFSEDSKYVIVQAVNWDTVSTDPRPRLVVYDVNTLQSVTVLDLDDYDQRNMYVTDWRYLVTYRFDNDTEKIDK